MFHDGIWLRARGLVNLSRINCTKNLPETEWKAAQEQSIKKWITNAAQIVDF